MSDPTSPSAEGSHAGAGARKGKERFLVFIVVLLGLLIVAGIVAVVLRIIYLSANPEPQVGRSAEASAVVAGEAGAPAVRLSLPDGATVKALSLSGDRLAVHYQAPAGEGITVLDVRSGDVLQRIELGAGAPAP